MKKKFKAFSYLFFIMFLSCGRNGEDSVYLIPKDYQGNLLIVFNQDNGMDTIYEQQAKIYSFDTTGMLMTKFAPNYGVKQHRYYHVDTFGHRTNLKYALPSQLKRTNDVMIINHQTGNNYNSSKHVERHFEILTVARGMNVDSIANLRSDFMWKRLK